MTNSLAIWIGIIIAVALAVDAVLFGWQYSFFLAQKFAGLLRWLAFWR